MSTFIIIFAKQIIIDFSIKKMYTQFQRWHSFTNEACDILLTNAKTIPLKGCTFTQCHNLNKLFISCLETTYVLFTFWMISLMRSPSSEVPLNPWIKTTGLYAAQNPTRNKNHNIVVFLMMLTNSMVFRPL